MPIQTKSVFSQALIDIRFGRMNEPRICFCIVANEVSRKAAFKIIKFYDCLINCYKVKIYSLGS